MEKKNNNLVIILMGVIIVILAVLCILFATDTITLNTKDNEVSNSNNTITEDNNKNDEQPQEKKDYSRYIGSWHNDETQNEITIKNITDNEITFTWFLYRLAGIDDDTTIAFNNGEAIFYYQGYDDKNFDSKQTEDEKYIRKATIKLLDNSVDVVVEDVNSIDSNYKILDNFAGSVYIKAGTYTHSNKYR